MAGGAVALFCWVVLLEEYGNVQYCTVPGVKGKSGELLAAKYIVNTAKSSPDFFPTPTVVSAVCVYVGWRSFDVELVGKGAEGRDTGMVCVIVSY
ncbi:hypothetical protein L873DRAFT_1812036 [Choiromyces venosus 120613-1]|uniref:Secreted protein n=1 Tax=Choiromyces venosus 120613-1 TaxID=1336337 RepID=A0A3N4JFA0_9PEZI|nr:hypothetical protein L873DRAFT_1812036 [Choiromyces venosus 120613-1]